MVCPFEEMDCDVLDVPFDDLTYRQKIEVINEFIELIPADAFQDYNFTRRRKVGRKRATGHWYGRLVSRRPYIGIIRNYSACPEA